MVTTKIRTIISFLGKLNLVSRILYSLFIILVLIVVVIGLDTVVGIITGMTAAAVLIVELSRRWCRIRSFVYLAVGSILAAIFVSGLYQEVAGPLALRIGGEGAFDSLGWLIYHNIVSYGILLIVPGCIAVGVGGAITRALLNLRKRLQRNNDSGTPCSPPGGGVAPHSV